MGPKSDKQQDILSEFEPIFFPQSIAIAGASQTERKVGTLMLRNFLSAGFQGKLYPVNPEGGSVYGLEIYQNMQSIPYPVDYVIVSIPAASVPDLLGDCAAKGVKAVQIFSAGFSETGREEDRRIEEEMVTKARKAEFRVIGPNCVGISCPASGIPVPSSGGIGKPGSVALLSQSGGHTETLADIGCVRGIRFSKMISFGNRSDLNELDFLSYLIADPYTQVIGIYIEGTRDAPRFFHLIREAAKIKPVVIWKGGETDVGREMAVSHTGSLSGSDSTWDAAIKQAGAVRVRTLEELADTLLAFQNLPEMSGNRAGIISQLGGGAGGVAVSASDVCSWHGLELPHPDKKSQAQLRDVIRGAGTILRNPLDLGMAGRFPEILGKVTNIMASDPAIDFLMVNERVDFLLLFASLEEIHATNEALIDFRKNNEKPLIIVSTPVSADAERREVEDKLAEANIPVYPSFERAAKAIANVSNYWGTRTAAELYIKT